MTFAIRKLGVKSLTTLLLTACIFDVASSVTMWALERSFVNSIATGIRESENPVKAVQDVTRKVHAISQDRIGLLQRSERFGWLRPSLTPPLAMGLFGEGACGYISYLEIEVLEAVGFDARPVQILGDGGLNLHVIVEATKGEEVIFVDPLYDWVYLDDRGRPVTRVHLETQWSTLIEAAPLDGILQYPIDYGIRYTNWNALGKVGSYVEAGMRTVFGEAHTADFSFRAVMPNYYVLRITIVGILGLFVLVARRKLMIAHGQQ